MMRSLFATAALAVSLLAAGCGASPVAAPQTHGTKTMTAKIKGGTNAFDYDKATQDKINRGELSQRYGSFFRGTVEHVSHASGRVVAKFQATSDSQTPGCVTVWLTPNLSHVDPGTVKVGDTFRLFVDYTLVDVKSGEIWDIHRPYQAFIEQ